MYDGLAGADAAEGDGGAHDEGEGQRDGGGVTGGDDPLLPAPLEGGARRRSASPPCARSPVVHPRHGAAPSSRPCVRPLPLLVARTGPCPEPELLVGNWIRGWRRSRFAAHRGKPVTRPRRRPDPCRTWRRHRAGGRRAERRSAALDRRRCRSIRPWLAPTWFIDSDDPGRRRLRRRRRPATPPTRPTSRCGCSTPCATGSATTPTTSTTHPSAFRASSVVAVVVELVRAEVGAADRRGPAHGASRPASASPTSATT